MVLSSGVKPERDGLVFGELTRRDAFVEVDEDVERGSRRHAPVVGVESPPACGGGGRSVGFEISAHAVGSSPEAGALGAHAAAVG